MLFGNHHAPQKCLNPKLPEHILHGSGKLSSHSSLIYEYAHI